MAIKKAVADYWLILKISKTSSKEEIKKAYRKLSKEFHPDINKEAGAQDQFIRITEAYDYWMENFDILLNKPTDGYSQTNKNKFNDHYRQYSRYAEEMFRKKYDYCDNAYQDTYRKHDQTANSFKKEFETFDVSTLESIREALEKVLHKKKTEYKRNYEYQYKPYPDFDPEKSNYYNERPSHKPNPSKKFETKDGKDYFHTTVTEIISETEFLVRVPYGFAALNDGVVILQHHDLTLGTFKVAVPKFTTYPWKISIRNIGTQPFTIRFEENIS